MSTFLVYERSIDNGNGIQIVYVHDGKIVSQFLSAKSLSHFYTGPGNPEWIGQDVTVLRGCGFKKVRSKSRVELAYENWLYEE